MRTFFFCLLAAIYLSTGISCQNAILASHPRKGRACFWRNSDPGLVYSLYVNDEYKGVLPYLADSLTRPGNRVVQEQGLVMHLLPGEYSIIAKDGEGRTACKGLLSIKISRTSTDISSSWNNSNCRVQMIYGD
jgi:hypothetical protein